MVLVHNTCCMWQLYMETEQLINPHDTMHYGYHNQYTQGGYAIDNMLCLLQKQSVQIWQPQCHAV